MQHLEFPVPQAASFKSTLDHLPPASGQPDCLLKSDRPHSFGSHTSFSIKRAVPTNCEHSVILITPQLLSGQAEYTVVTKRHVSSLSLLIHDSADMAHVQ